MLNTLSIFNRACRLFPARESLVCDIPAGDGKIANLFYSVCSLCGSAGLPGLKQCVKTHLEPVFLKYFRSPGIDSMEPIPPVFVA
jgi:hypothetical protein